jgi:hypothetical protein
LEDKKMRPKYRQYAALVVEVESVSPVRRVCLVEATDERDALDQLAETLPPKWKAEAVFEVLETL